MTTPKTPEQLAQFHGPEPRTHALERARTIAQANWKIACIDRDRAEEAAREAALYAAVTAHDARTATFRASTLAGIFSDACDAVYSDLQ